MNPRKENKKWNYTIYLVLFYCSFTAEEVLVEYVVITKPDFRCQPQRHITGLW